MLRRLTCSNCGDFLDPLAPEDIINKRKGEKQACSNCNVEIEITYDLGDLILDLYQELEDHRELMHDGGE